MAFPWAVLRQNNTTDLITGAGQYQVMSGGYYLADVYENFAPLTDFIKKSDYAKGMIPGLMEPGRSEWYDGQQVGIPFGIDAYGLMVNKDILAKAGVEPKFATWEDVIAACEKIEQAAKDVACLSHSTGNPEQIGAFFFSAYDGPYVDKDGKYALDPAQGRRGGRAPAAPVEAPAAGRPGADLRRGRAPVRRRQGRDAGRLAELLDQDARRPGEVEDRRQVDAWPASRAPAFPGSRSGSSSCPRAPRTRRPPGRGSRPSPARRTRSATWSSTASTRSGSRPTRTRSSPRSTSTTGR